MTSTHIETHSPRIVVGVDGSDAAAHALDWAVGWAGRHRFPISVVSCFTVPFIGEPYTSSVYSVEAQIETAQKEHEDLVAAAVDRVRQLDVNADVSGEVLFDSAAAALPQIADPTDVLVVGSTGRSGAMQGLLGSVATAVCHRARGLVIVVPSLPSPSGTAAWSKIVVGVDGSPNSTTALRWAHEEARVTGADLVVLHAWMYPYGELSGRDEMASDAFRELQASLATLELDEGSDVKVTTELVENHPASALVFASADAQLLVVGSRGRGPFASAVLGSVSRTVVQHAKCPVAVVRREAE